MTENKYDTIVVGGGIAGLTAAVYQARAKKNVLLIEKNKELGGLVNSFSHNGFHFDTGVRALESAGIIFPMLEDLGIKLDFVKSPVSVGIEKDIVHIKNLDSLKDYKNMLKKIYPESDREIDEAIKIIRKVMKHMDVLYGVENPVFKDLRKDTKFIFKKLLPWLPKFLFTVGKINRMNMPVEDYLDKIIKNPSLKDIISQHFFKKTPTFFALSYFSLYLDYYYPKGGVGTLADALKDKILAYGGEIKIETTITYVIANQNLVKDEHDNSRCLVVRLRSAGTAGYFQKKESGLIYISSHYRRLLRRLCENQFFRGHFSRAPLERAGFFMFSRIDSSGRVTPLSQGGQESRNAFSIYHAV